MTAKSQGTLEKPLLQGKHGHRIKLILKKLLESENALRPVTL